MGIVVPLPDPTQLPSVLRESKHWILWKAEQRDEGKIAKVPCDHAGQPESMKIGHCSFVDALMHVKRIRAIRGENFGVGVAFTDDIGFVGVDLDGALIDGQRSEHLKWAMEEHATWGEFSLSGVGVHLFYQGRFEGKRNAVVDGAKIELFGTKGFIAITGRTLPGSLSELSSFEPINETLSPFLVKERKPTTIPNGTFAPRNGSVGNHAYGLAALDEQCTRLRVAPGGTLHYTLCSAAFKIGQLVPSYIDWQTAEDRLYEATEQGGGKDMGLAMRTLRSQLEYGTQCPFHPKDQFAESLNNGVDLSCFGQSEDAVLEPIQTIQDPGEFPAHLLVVPGFINDVMQYTLQNSFVVQPVLALAGALALMSVLTGRKIKDRNGCRTNAYILSVAASGEGKDAARKTNKRILYAAGAGSFVGAESWASGPGLLAAVEKQPAVLFQNDEVGRFLQTTGDAQRSPHLFSIISILLKLYSSSDDVFLGDVYADGRQSSISQPHCVLYGTTVPGSLYASLSHDSLTNGLLSRMFIFEAGDTPGELQEPDAVEPWDELTTTARKWFQWQPTPGNLAGQNPEPFAVPISDDAEHLFRELRTHSRDQRVLLGDVFGALWVRAVENARKLALLYACSVAFGEQAHVTIDAAQWACDVTKHLCQRLCWVASQNVSRNSVESTSMEMERLIRGAKKKGISSIEIYTKTRHLKAKERNEILSSLIECGVIQKTLVKTKSRPKVIYVAM